MEAPGLGADGRGSAGLGRRRPAAVPSHAPPATAEASGPSVRLAKVRRTNGEGASIGPTPVARASRVAVTLASPSPVRAFLVGILAASGTVAKAIPEVGRPRPERRTAVLLTTGQPIPLAAMVVLQASEEATTD